MLSAIPESEPVADLGGEGAEGGGGGGGRDAFFRIRPLPTQRVFPLYYSFLGVNLY